MLMLTFFCAALLFELHLYFFYFLLLTCRFGYHLLCDDVIKTFCSILELIQSILIHKCQHKSTRINMSQHVSTRIRHESTRVQHESTRINSSSTQANTNQHESDTSQHESDTSTTRANTSQLDQGTIIVYCSFSW